MKCPPPIPFRDCQHPPESVHPAPRHPMRWGSSPTDVCDACGGHRLTLHHPGEWREGPPDTTATELD